MRISKEALEARLETAKRIYEDGRISKDLYDGLVKATMELHLVTTVKGLKSDTRKLTAYDFACGYVQREGEVRLYKDGVYHVQDDLGYWESYGTLTEARRDFARMVKRWNKAAAATA